MGPAVMKPRHHTPFGYRNNYVESVTKNFGEVLRWQWARLRDRLPPAATLATPQQAPNLEFLRSNAQAGSAMIPAVTWIGHATALDYLWRFLVPTLIGNTIGGVALVAILNHAPLATEA